MTNQNDGLDPRQDQGETAAYPTFGSAESSSSTEPSPQPAAAPFAPQPDATETLGGTPAAEPYASWRPADDTSAPDTSAYGYGSPAADAVASPTYATGSPYGPPGPAPTSTESWMTGATAETPAPALTDPNAGYGWTGGPGGPTGPGGPMGTGPGKDRGPKKRRPFLMVGTTAVLTALLASGGTAYFTGAFDSGSDVTDGKATYQELGSQKSKGSVPVSGSTSQNPNWQKVADTVRESVVAIRVSTGDQQGSQGSGVIVNAEKGQIVTNNHVVSGAKEIQVVLADGRVFEAEIVGTDPTTDLAVIKLKDIPGDLKEAKLGDSSSVAVGESVMAVGNPLGLDNTVTTGIISAINRPVSTVADDSSQTVVTNALQIDAAINPGNSGGPLFNSAGEVIGINSSIATLQSESGSSSQSGSIGLGFAIPSNQVDNIAKQLIDSGKAAHPQIGVSVAQQPASVEVEGVTRQGAKIVDVTGDSAKSAGLKKDDVIVAVNGEATGSSDSVIAWIRSFKVGDKVKLTVVSSDGSVHDVNMTLEQAQDSGKQYQPRQEQDWGDLLPGE